MENEFYTRTALERVYDILVEARRLGATTFETTAVLDLIARHKDLEKNHIKSALFILLANLECNFSQVFQ